MFIRTKTTKVKEITEASATDGLLLATTVEYGKCVATVPLFAVTFNRQVSNVLCEKAIILVELLFELRIVVIQDSEDGK